MKIDRVLELLKIERECVTRQSPCNEKSKLCDRNCGECDIAQNDLEIIEMYNFVISMIETLSGWSQWTSVKDRLPNEKQSEITHDFEYVLCATTFGDVRAYKFGTPIGWSEPHFWHGAGIMDEYVTHWMPFPDMPVLT